jgi:hypothetical protein
MYIVRETLIEPKNKTIVGTYSNIGTHTGRRFVECAAQDENTKLGNLFSIKCTDEQHPENPDLVLHYATLHDSNNQPTVRFYAEWLAEDDENDEPDTIIEGPMQM